MAPKFEQKAKDRIKKGLERYIPILQQASQRGVSEEDTSTIVQSILVDLLGYDRFSELTGQYAVKGRWVDWAIKVNDCINFFVEVKPLGTKLRDRDLFQVTSYSRQHSLDWAVLSTGDVWQCHRVTGGQDTEECFEVRMLDSTQPLDEKVDCFYLLSREGFSKGALNEHWTQKECFRPDRLAQLILSDDVLNALRRNVHKENPGRRVEIDALREAVIRGVMRGNLPLVDTPDNSGKPEKTQKPRNKKQPTEPQ